MHPSKYSTAHARIARGSKGKSRYATSSDSVSAVRMPLNFGSAVSGMMPSTTHVLPSLELRCSCGLPIEFGSPPGCTSRKLPSGCSTTWSCTVLTSLLPLRKCGGFTGALAVVTLPQSSNRRMNRTRALG